MNQLKFYQTFVSIYVKPYEKLKNMRNSKGRRKYSNFIESLWIDQKYGKLKNAIIWLPGGYGTLEISEYSYIRSTLYRNSNHWGWCVGNRAILCIS